MKSFRNIFIGISMGISLTKIFGGDVIVREFILLFLGLAALTELIQKKRSKND